MTANRKIDPATDWLEWFYTNADFGPAHSDVVQMMREEYEVKTGRKVPAAYQDEC